VTPASVDSSCRPACCRVNLTGALLGLCGWLLAPATGLAQQPHDDKIEPEGQDVSELTQPELQPASQEEPPEPPAPPSGKQAERPSGDGRAGNDRAYDEDEGSGGAIPAEQGLRLGTLRAPDLLTGTSDVPEETSTTSADASEAPGSGAEVPRVVRVASWRLGGSLIDPPRKLDTLVSIYLGPERYFVEAGPADASGLPVATIPRLARAFRDIGYESEIDAARLGDAVVLSIVLRPADRVRHIYVTGNWPLRQDEIVRRLSFRPGDALPPEGPARDAFLTSERERMLTFLRTEGYLDAQLDLELRAKKGTVPADMNVLISVRLGTGYPVGPIRVKGAKAVDPEWIADQFRHRFLSVLWPVPFHMTTARSDASQIEQRYRQLYYPGARLSLEPGAPTLKPFPNVPLEITVNERKKLDILFEGSTCCRESTLRDQLTFFERGAYDDYEIRRSTRQLALYLRGEGYMFARVTARRERVDAKIDRVVFLLNEGPRIRVSSVSVAGHTRFSSEQLLSVVKTRRRDIWAKIGLSGAGYTSLKQLEADAGRLAGFYRARGYKNASVSVFVGATEDTKKPLESVVAGCAVLADTAIRSDEPERQQALKRCRQPWSESRRIHAVFQIDSEGERLRVGSVRVVNKGTTPLPRDEEFLRRSMLIRPGHTFRQSALRADRDRLLEVLRDDGYPNAQVEPSFELSDADENTFDITFSLNTQARVAVGPVFIRGNFLTQNRTIERWLPLRPGEPLKTKDLEQAQRDLSLLQYFTNANPIRFPAGKEALEAWPVIVRVVERHDHWGRIRLGGGASTDQRDPDGDLPLGGFASIGYEHGNLLGLGYRLQGRGDFGNALTRGQLDFEDPRLWGTLNRLQITGLYLRQATVRLGDIESGSATIGVARQVHPGLDTFIRYGIRNIVRTENFRRVAGADQTQSTVRIGTAVGDLSVGFQFLRIDHLLVPNQGYRLEASVSLAAPALSFGFGDATFLKFNVRALSVLPLSKRVKLRYGLRYDHGVPIDGAALLPKVERFSAGGDTTVRGYGLDRLRNQISLTPTAGGLSLQQARPIGGSVRIISNVDLQVEISGPWHGAIFWDSGVLQDSLESIGPKRFRHGVGFSPLLVKLPIGDLSVSWAWPLNPRVGDSRTGRLHFNVGLMF